MAFDHRPTGYSDGLPEGRIWRLDRSHVSGSPGLENALGVVEMVLVLNDREYLDSPVCLATGRVSMMRLICPRNPWRYRLDSRRPAYPDVDWLAR